MVTTLGPNHPGASGSAALGHLQVSVGPRAPLPRPCSVRGLQCCCSRVQVLDWTPLGTRGQVEERRLLSQALASRIRAGGTPLGARRSLLSLRARGGGPEAGRGWSRTVYLYFLLIKTHAIIMHLLGYDVLFHSVWGKIKVKMERMSLYSIQFSKMSKIYSH